MTAGPPDSPTLHIDWTRCHAHQLCAAQLPTAITLDDWGYPQLHPTQLTHQPPTTLNRAIHTCPTLALHTTAIRAADQALN